MRIAAELTEEMEMWNWDLTLGNRWARIAKCSQLLNIRSKWQGTPMRSGEYDLGEGNA
jgi:hypothetical protein